MKTIDGVAPEEPEIIDSGRRMDQEIRTMAALLRILDDLDEPAKGRVVRWLADRYSGSGCRALAI